MLVYTHQCHATVTLDQMPVRTTPLWASRLLRTLKAHTNTHRRLMLDSLSLTTIAANLQTPQRCSQCAVCHPFSLQYA